MAEPFWLRGANTPEGIEAKRRAQRVQIKETLQAAVRSIVRQAAQIQEAIPQPFPLWPGPLCDAFLHGLKPGKDLFLLLITRFPELIPPKPSASVSTTAKLTPLVAAALKMQAPKALPPPVSGSLIEDTSDMVDKTVIKGNVAGAFLTQARRVLPLLSSSESKCLALIAIGLNLSFLSALLMPVFGSADVRRTYYEDWAFMRDSDDVVLLAAMLHTLEPIDFAISPAPDRIALYLAPPTAAQPEEPPPKLGVDAQPTVPKRKAKKKIAQIADKETEARRQREEEEREEREMKEAYEREVLLRDEAARAALLESARKEEMRRKDELRKKEEIRLEAERAEVEAQRCKKEEAEREVREREQRQRDEERRREEERRAEEERKQQREEELLRQLAEERRRNEELLRERERMLYETRLEEERKRAEEERRKAAELEALKAKLLMEEKKRDEERRKADEDRRKAELERRKKEEEEERLRVQEERRKADESARKERELAIAAARAVPVSVPSLPSPPTPTATANLGYSSFVATMDRSEALMSASSSGGEEKKSDSENFNSEERLAAIKAARVEAMRKRIADDIDLRLKRELGSGASSSSVAALIFSSASPTASSPYLPRATNGSAVPSVPSPAQSSVTLSLSSSSPPASLSTASVPPAAATTSPSSPRPAVVDNSARQKEEEEEMLALRLAAERQREREEKQRQELLLKKRLERERQEEERRKEEERIREEIRKKIEEEQRQRALAAEAERVESLRRKEAERREAEKRLEAIEAARSEEIRKELARQEELRKQRAERERLEAIREQQAAAAATAVRAEEETQAQRAREKEEAARKAKEKEDAKLKTEAGRAEALRNLLADMLAPKKPAAKTENTEVTSTSTSPPTTPSYSSSPSAATILSVPLALSRSDPALPSLPPPPARNVSLPLPVPPMKADIPALPLASPSPPIARVTPPATSFLPPIPSAASTLAPAAQITALPDTFSFFEESDSGPETAPEVRGAWRTIYGSHDSSDLFASVALAAAPLQRKLDKSLGRAPSPRPSPRSVSPQLSPRGGAPQKFVWAPPRKQLYFRLESQRPASEQGNVCYGCGKALPSRPLHCEYTNKWFCSACHTGAKHVIPARILHHWDLRPYSVSDFALGFLQSIAAEAMLDVGAVNPGLYELVPQLQLVKAFRRKLGWMKNYVLVCREQANLLRPFLRTSRSHLLYSLEMYALRDFLDLSAGTLVPFLEEQYQAWLVHFPRCELCRARAIVCELCRGANGLFFPWERGVARCPRCDSFFHRACTATRRGCPRCARERAKRQLSASKNAGSSF